MLPVFPGSHQPDPGASESQVHPASPDSIEPSGSGSKQQVVSALAAASAHKTIFYQDVGQKEKSYMCDYCDARFSSDSGLWKHKNRIHLKKATYVCPFCGKGYFDKNRHEDHIYNVHNNIKSHKCPYCPSRFAYKTSLYPHIRDKHGREVSVEEDIWARGMEMSVSKKYRQRMQRPLGKKEEGNVLVLSACAWNMDQKVKRLLTIMPAAVCMFPVKECLCFILSPT